MRNNPGNKLSSRLSVFRDGAKDGLPIALGYFAVSFSLGIAARNAGLTPFQGFMSSLLTNASAGSYALFTSIAAQSSALEIALITLVANARYLLMSAALSQKMSPELSLGHRLAVGFDVTDEIFGISIARPGKLDPLYNYGAMSLCLPGWAFGTMLGIIMGNLLPARIVRALSVALYGMFIAIIVPPGKKDRIVLVAVIISFLSSFALSRMAVFSALSSGTRIIILTVAISAVAALFFPHIEEEVDINE